MNLRQTTSSPTAARPPNPGPLPRILTLQEAARVTGTSPEVLWQEIRAGRIPFTLVSGRSDMGVLLNTEDLIRIGGVKHPAGRPWVQTPADRAPVHSPPRSARPTKARVSPIRIGAYTGTAIAAAMTLLLLALLIPSLVARQPSETISSGLSGPVDPRCTGQPNTKACRASQPSREAKGSASRSGAQSPALAPAPGGTGRPAGSEAGSPAASGVHGAFGLPAPAGMTSPTPSPSPSASPPPNGYPVPARIASNCSRDVTSDLLGWIKTVPNNSTLLFSSGSCYRIDGTMHIENRIGLTFQGNGTTFSGKFHTQGKTPHWGVYSSKSITFRDMIVRGANPHAGLYSDAYQPPLQWEAAWEIDGSQDVLLDSVQAYDVFGDFVTIEPLWIGQGPVNSRNITIRNSHFERNGRSGIDITGAQSVTISNNYIGKIRHALLSMEPEWPTMPIDDVRFTGNRTGGVWLLWIANGGICNAGVSNVYVADNVMQADAGMPLLHVNPPSGCPKRGPFTIERNTLIARSSPYAAFCFIQVRDAIVRDNRVVFLHDPRTRVLVQLAVSTRVSVLDNQVSADPRDTLRFVSADPGSDYVESGNVRV